MSKAVRALTLLIAALAALLLLVATFEFGPASSHMAMHYFSAADALLAGEEMRMSRGEPFTLWPPLMPFLLAGAKLLGVGYTRTCWFLGGLSLFAFLGFGADLLARLFGSARLGLAHVLVLATSPLVFLYFKWVHSEPLFVALVVTALWMAVAFLERPSAWLLVGMTAASALACLQRYVGLTVVVTIALMLVFAPRGDALRRRWLRSAIFAAASVLPIALWFLRNLRVEGNTSGERDAADIPLAENLRSISETVDAWVLPRAWLPFAPGPIVIAALVAIALVLAFARSPRPGQRRAITVYAAFPSVYLVLLALYASAVQLDTLETRLLLPVYTFVWGILLLGLREALHRLEARAPGARVPAQVVAAGLVCVQLAANSSLWYADFDHTRREGAGGLTARDWAEAPVVRWLQANAPDGAILSNLPEIVYAAIGRRAEFVSPERQKATVEDALARNGVTTLVWITESGRPELRTRNVDKVARLALLAEFEDARVYRVEPLP